MTPITLPIAEMNSVDLPPVCIVTGSKSEVSFHKVKFAWYPSWVWILAPFALLIAAILAAILTKRANGELPFSPAGWSRWRTAKILLGLSVVVFLVGLFGGIGALAAEASGVGMALLAVGIILPIVALVVLGNRGPKVTKITDTEISLKIPSAEATQAIQAHLHAGAPAQAAPVARAG